MNKHEGFKAIRSLDYVILLCDDLAKMKAFYQRLFEFQVEEDFSECMVFFRVGTLFLGLRTRGRAYDGPSVAPLSASIQISFRVPPADVDLAYERLVQDGFDVIEPPTNQDWTHRTLFFRDPEHNIVEIFADIHPRETLAEPSGVHQVVD
ncbi:VOC family protein [uncultured Roseobacter sp.]|uniref:VOC family protein n=1 Tax=uncultured Roseobacter sp. TaxID=114847 RepID=UPI0026091515|nr:VOC family protein [uncultured Roseobacter sp.]